ncbi:MAG TPA: PPC domain-containing protein [Frankiaceae bacterium]|nr:PPC domain-containing protein [Frankiaceae bacterium]
MLRRHAIATTAVLVALGTVSLAPATAAPKPKPFSGTKAYTDATPDPTGSAPDSGNGCDSMLPAPFPHETGFTINVPAPGKLKVSINNTGDWALEVRDAKGTQLGASDGATPETTELVTVKAKKAGKYTILPCNLGGAPDVTVTYAYTPA